jgi:ketosteroid isomerase-like protein
MSSAEHPNVTLIKQGFAHLEAGNVEAFLELYHPDILWYGTDLDGQPTIMDKEKMLRNTAEMVGQLEESSSTPVELEAVGDELVVGKVRARRRAKGDPEAVEALFLIFYRIEDGRIVRGGDFAPKVLEDFWARYREQR